MPVGAIPVIAEHESAALTHLSGIATLSEQCAQSRRVQWRQPMHKGIVQAQDFGVMVWANIADHLRLRRQHTAR